MMMQLLAGKLPLVPKLLKFRPDPASTAYNPQINISIFTLILHWVELSVIQLFQIKLIMQNSRNSRHWQTQYRELSSWEVWHLNQLRLSDRTWSGSVKLLTWSSQEFHWNNSDSNSDPSMSWIKCTLTSFCIWFDWIKFDAWINMSGFNAASVLILLE